MLKPIEVVELANDNGVKQAIKAAILEFAGLVVLAPEVLQDGLKPSPQLQSLCLDVLRNYRKYEELFFNLLVYNTNTVFSGKPPTTTRQAVLTFMDKDGKEPLQQALLKHSVSIAGLLVGE